MRKLIAVGVTLAVLGGFSAEAFAEKISLKVKFDALRTACAKAGGTFGASGGGGYTCVKTDCDKKGGICQITCKKNGQCTGDTPTRIAAAASVATILNDGVAAQSGAPASSIIDSGPRFSAPRPAPTGRPAPN